MTKKKKNKKTRSLGIIKRAKFSGDMKKKPDYQNDGQLTYKVSPEWHF